MSLSQDGLIGIGGGRLSRRHFRGTGTWDGIWRVCAPLYSAPVGSLGDYSPGLKRSGASHPLTPEMLSRAGWVATGGETLDRAGGDNAVAS